MTAEQIAENFESVRNQIKEAEKKSGRKEAVETYLAG